MTNNFYPILLLLALFIFQVYGAIRNSWIYSGDPVGIAKDRGPHWFVAVNTETGPHLFEFNEGGEIIETINLTELSGITDLDKATDITSSWSRVYISGTFGIVSFSTSNLAFQHMATGDFQRVSTDFGNGDVVVGITSTSLYVFSKDLGTHFTEDISLLVNDCELVDVALSDKNTVAVAGNIELVPGLWTPFVRVYMPRLDYSVNWEYLYSLYDYTYAELISNSPSMTSSSKIGKVEFGQDGDLYLLGEVWGEKNVFTLTASKTGFVSPTTGLPTAEIDQHRYFKLFGDIQEEDHQLFYTRVNLAYRNVGIQGDAAFVVPSVNLISTEADHVFSSSFADIGATASGAVTIAARSGKELVILKRNDWESSSYARKRKRGRGRVRVQVVPEYVAPPSMFSSGFDGTDPDYFSVTGLAMNRRDLTAVVGSCGPGEGFIQMWEKNGESQYSKVLNTQDGIPSFKRSAKYKGVRPRWLEATYKTKAIPRSTREVKEINWAKRQTLPHVEMDDIMFVYDFTRAFDWTSGNLGGDDCMEHLGYDVDADGDIFTPCYVMYPAQGEWIDVNITVDVSAFWNWRIMASTRAAATPLYSGREVRFQSFMRELPYYEFPVTGYHPDTEGDWYLYGYNIGLEPGLDPDAYLTTYYTVYLFDDSVVDHGNRVRFTWWNNETRLEYVQFSRGR